MNIGYNNAKNDSDSISGYQCASKVVNTTINYEPYDKNWHEYIKVVYRKEYSQSELGSLPIPLIDYLDFYYSRSVINVVSAGIATKRKIIPWNGKIQEPYVINFQDQVNTPYLVKDHEWMEVSRVSSHCIGIKFCQD